MSSVDDARDATEDPFDSTTSDMRFERAAQAADSAADRHVGRRLGPYRIERPLGRGGMGVVYLAVREDDYEQRVAVKWMQPERLSVLGLDRFVQERQILAELDHPNIARLLDGGTTDDALPYLVMEYVEGEPIDRYGLSQGLSLRQRLELFCTVCEAVHAAHRKLVIHRDLKPANVLVTTDGTVKLLDFGIAKLLDPSGIDDGPRTVPGHEPMTPRYASPEQLLGETVSTSSDVYSLGVLLCTMLTGTLPYGEVATGTAHWVDAICHREPIRPSELAEDPAESRQLVGDLDAILLKALRKEADLRYASALQLAEDVRRHLEHRPVEARDGTILYLTRKLVRRHKLGAALALSILVFSLATTVLWRTAVEERTRAESSLLRAERVSTFLEELFRGADPNVAQGETPSLREALDRSRARLLEGELAEEPDVRAELLSTLGTVYNDLGYLDEARQLKIEAIRVRRADDPSDRPELATDLNNLGRILFDEGDVVAADQALREAVAMWGRLGAATDADRITGLRNLAAVAMHRQRYDEAIRHHQDVIALEARLDAEPAARAATLYSLGTVHRLRDDPAAAEPLLRQALEGYRRAHGTTEHTRVAAVQSSLARALHRLGRLAEARNLYESALDVRLRLLGEEHVRVAITRVLLAELLLDDRVFGDRELILAEDHLTAAIEVLQRHHRESVPHVDARSDIQSDARGGTRSTTRLATAESVWGLYLLRIGRVDEAETTLEASYDALRVALGEDDLATRDAARRLATIREAPTRSTSEVSAPGE